jgi:hypothetical protein
MIKQPKFYRVTLALFLVVVLFVAQGIYPVLAIGPGTGGSKIRVNDEQIGPYTLLVATAPLPVTVGQMSVWVRVTDTETNNLRRDAVVTVTATPRNGGETLTAQGSHKYAGNNYDYVAHLPVDQSGQWEVSLTVEDELGQAETAFYETVSRGSNVTLLVVFGLLFAVLAVGVGIYLWRRAAASDAQTNKPL